MTGVVGCREGRVHHHPVVIVGPASRVEGSWRAGRRDPSPTALPAHGRRPRCRRGLAPASRSASSSRPQPQKGSGRARQRCGRDPRRSRRASGRGRIIPQIRATAVPAAAALGVSSSMSGRTSPYHSASARLMSRSVGSSKKRWPLPLAEAPQAHAARHGAERLAVAGPDPPCRQDRPRRRREGRELGARSRAAGADTRRGVQRRGVGRSLAPLVAESTAGSPASAGRRRRP